MAGQDWLPYLILAAVVILFAKSTFYDVKNFKRHADRVMPKTG